MLHIQTDKINLVDLALLSHLMTFSNKPKEDLLKNPNFLIAKSLYDEHKSLLPQVPDFSFLFKENFNSVEHFTFFNNKANFIITNEENSQEITLSSKLVTTELTEYCLAYNEGFYLQKQKLDDAAELEHINDLLNDFSTLSFCYLSKPQDNILLNMFFVMDYLNKNIVEEDVTNKTTEEIQEIVDNSGYIQILSISIELT